MQAALRKILRINPGEGWLVFVLGLILFSNSVAQQIAGIVSVSGFITSGGPNGVLVIWLIDMTLILVISGLQSLVVDRFNRLTMARLMLLSFALIYLLLRVMFALRVSEQLIYAVMFIFADLQFIIFPLIFWVMTNDITDLAQGKRIFPLIGGAGFAGKLLGIAITFSIPTLLSDFGIRTEEVLTFNIILYILTVLIAWVGLRSTRTQRISPSKGESIKETVAVGWEFVWNVPAFRFLMLAVLAASVALTVNEFRFLVVSKATFSTRESYQSFYSGYRLAITLVSMVMQGFITSRIIEKVGLRKVFFMLPVSLLGGGLWMIAQPNIWGALGGMFIPKWLQKTVDESGMNSMQGLIPEEKRGRVSSFIKSYPPAIGTILGALLIGIVQITGNNSWNTYAYLSIGVLASVLSVVFIYEMYRTYDVSLLNWRMKRRQRTNSVVSRLEF